MTTDNTEIHAGFLRRGAVSLTTAPPGIDVPALSIFEAVDMATGAALPGETFAPLKVMYLNPEDDQDALHNQVACLLAESGRSLEAVAGRLAIQSLTEHPRFFLLGGDPPSENEGVRAHLEAALRTLEIDVLVVEFWHGLNHAEHGGPAFGRLLRRLAAETGVAIHATERASGPRPGLTARAIRTLAPMTEAEAGLADHRQFFRAVEVETAFARPSPPGAWFEKRAVTVPNGEPMGIVAPAGI